ncbi:MAG: periplasmic heavy metal sensor [Candidatus Omnitrophota bacterium]
MKKTMKRIMAILVAAVLVLTAPISYATGPVCGQEDAERNKKGEHFRASIEKLDITEDQKEKLLEQRQAHWEKMKGLRKAMNEQRKELRKELEKKEYSKKDIDATVAQMKYLQGDMITQRVDHFLQMKEVLTPEQFKQMTEMKEKKGHRKRHGKKSGEYSGF